MDMNIQTIVHECSYDILSRILGFVEFDNKCVNYRFINDGNQHVYQFTCVAGNTITTLTNMTVSFRYLRLYNSEPCSAFPLLKRLKYLELTLRASQCRWISIPILPKLRTLKIMGGIGLTTLPSFPLLQRLYLQNTNIRSLSPQPSLKHLTIKGDFSIDTSHIRDCTIIKNIWKCCTDCPYKGLTNTMLKHHMQLRHGIGIVWRCCTHCAYRGRTNTRLIHHMHYRHGISIGE